MKFIYFKVKEKKKKKGIKYFSIQVMYLIFYTYFICLPCMDFPGVSDKAD